MSHLQLPEVVHEDGRRREEGGLGRGEHQLLQRLGLRAHDLPREVGGGKVDKRDGELGMCDGRVVRGRRARPRTKVGHTQRARSSVLRLCLALLLTTCTVSACACSCFMFMFISCSCMCMLHVHVARASFEIHVSVRACESPPEQR